MYFILVVFSGLFSDYKVNVAVCTHASVSRLVFLTSYFNSILFVAALFILLGVFIFLGFNKTLNQNLDGEGSVRYPFSLCILGGILCVATSVVSAIALRKHLLTFSDDDDDEGSIAEIV